MTSQVIDARPRDADDAPTLTSSDARMGGREVLMTVRDTASFLRHALLADGAVSGVTGLVLASGAPLAAPLFGLSTAFLAGIGVFLIAYGAVLVLLTWRPAVAPAAARTVIAGNAVWIVASLGFVLLGPASLTMLGKGFVVMQAAVVALLAELQWVGLRRHTLVGMTA
jgi:hypothetical protein